LALKDADSLLLAQGPDLSSALDTAMALGLPLDAVLDAQQGSFDPRSHSAAGADALEPPPTHLLARHHPAPSISVASSQAPVLQPAALPLEEDGVAAVTDRASGAGEPAQQQTVLQDAAGTLGSQRLKDQVLRRSSRLSQRQGPRAGCQASAAAKPASPAAATSAKRTPRAATASRKQSRQ
jgi:hypothetical protein